MATKHHGRKLVILAGTTGEHVAHAVNGQRKSGFPAPMGENAAHISVAVGERHAVKSAARQRADRRLGHEVRPQPRRVHAKIAHSSSPPLPAYGKYSMRPLTHSAIRQPAVLRSVL